MFKGKVWFKDGTMEYIVVGRYTEDDALCIIEEEFYDREISNYELERISDAPLLTVISVDAFNAIESY